MSPRHLFLATASALLLGAAPAPQAVSADQAFTELSKLVGTWRGSDQSESPLRIRFYLTAGGTVLVESWERTAGQPHSLTLYHRDGAKLIATHYCPQGNQPRLSLTVTGTKFNFAFRDATDLDAGESHLHQLGFDLVDANHPVRTETYRKDGKAEQSVLYLVRAAAAPARQPANP